MKFWTPQGLDHRSRGKPRDENLRQRDPEWLPLSIGESPVVPVAAAIANAVDDAVGVRIYDLPITAEKVLSALKTGAV